MLNMNLNKDRADRLKRRRYTVTIPRIDPDPVVVHPLGVYIQLDAKDQLRMLKLKPGEEIRLSAEKGGVAIFRRTS